MNNKGINLKFENADIHRGKIYFVDFDITLLFAMDIESGSVSIVSKIPEIPLIYQRAFGSMVISNGIVYLSPMRAEKLWIYDIERDYWEGISLICNLQEKLKFRSSIATEDSVYIAGYDSKMLLCLNKRNHEIKNLDVNVKFGFNIIEVDNNLFLPCREKNTIIKIEKRTNHISFLNVAYPSGFCAIEHYKGNFYIAPEHLGTLLRLKDSKNCTSIYEVEHIGNATTYISGLATNGNVLIMGTRHVDGTVVLNEKETEWHPGPSMFCFCKTMKDNSIVLSSLKGEIIRITKERDKREYHPIIKKNQFEDACEKFGINPALSNENGIVQESGWFSLDYFMRLIVEE